MAMRLRLNWVAQDKRILVIPDGDHNTLLMEGMAEYFKAIEGFVSGR